MASSGNVLMGNVLIIVENLPVPFDRRVWMEATTLRKAGYDITIISPQGRGFEKDYEVVEGIHIYRHPLPAESGSAAGYIKEYLCALSWEFRLARRIRRKSKFDVVHICNPPDLLFTVAGWFKIFHGARVIFDHHDLNPELFEAKYKKRGLFYYGLRLAEKLTFITADIVISTNDSYKDIALRRGGKKPEGVFIVRSGPDLSRFTPVAANPDYRRGRRYLVGYVGVMGEQEGIDFLLKAVHHVVYEKNRRDIHFMLIGNGPAFKRLKSLAGELNIDYYVEFTGRVSDCELIERLSSCDICVNPDPKTTFNDLSTMNKIMEYMALGKPIVQFDLLEGRRSAAGASLYAKPDDWQDMALKILYLADNPQLATAMGKTGRRRMEEQLEWRYQAPKLLGAYRKALDNNVSAGANMESEMQYDMQKF